MNVERTKAKGNTFTRNHKPKKLQDAAIQLSHGRGRTQLRLTALPLGSDWIIFIEGGKGHVGAVGVGVYDERNNHATSTVLTLSGHREDQIAKKGAERISFKTKRATVLTAGIHLDNITTEEIGEVIENSEHLITRFLSNL